MNKKLIINELHKNVINKHVLRVDGDKNEWTLSGDFLQELDNFIKEKLEQRDKEWEEKIEKEYELKYIPSDKEERPERDWFDSA